MAKLIFKAPYYKPGHKTDTGQSRGGYAKYIGTREGVEILRSGIDSFLETAESEAGFTPVMKEAAQAVQIRLLRIFQE